MKESTKALIEVFQDVIDEMPDEFTTHQFILKLAQKYQGLYIEALYPYRESDKPFATLHVELAHQLKNFNLDTIGKVKSISIFGTPSPCMNWRKV